MKSCPKTKKENMLLYVFSEAVKSILVKLETSGTVILPPTMSLLWFWTTLFFVNIYLSAPWVRLSTPFFSKR